MPADPGPGTAPKTQTILRILSAAPGVQPSGVFPTDTTVDSSPDSAPILVALTSNPPLRV